MCSFLMHGTVFLCLYFSFGEGSPAVLRVIRATSRWYLVGHVSKDLNLGSWACQKHNLVLCTNFPSTQMKVLVNISMWRHIYLTIKSYSICLIVCLVCFTILKAYKCQMSWSLQHLREILINKKKLRENRWIQLPWITLLQNEFVFFMSWLEWGN